MLDLRPTKNIERGAMALEPKINYSSSLLLNAHELEYRVYSDLLQIEALTYEWDKLLAASSCNRAFASAEWYLASCHMNSTSMPYVTVGMHGATIECILPLVRGSDDIAKFPHFGNDYNDLIVRSDHS